MRSRNLFMATLLGIIAVIVLLVGGNFYIMSMRSSLWNMSVKQILEVSEQGAHAFRVYVGKDIDMSRLLASKLSTRKSSELDEINYDLDLLSEEGANYILVDIDNGVYYSNFDYEQTPLTDEQLEVYKNLDENGLREPYENEYLGELSIGYYERFTFADGVHAVIIKSQTMTSLTKMFSLSFYDGSGISCIVNEKGDILVRLSETENSSFSNIFDAIYTDGENSLDDVEKLRQNIFGGENGAARLHYNNEECILTYIPIQGMDNWFLITLVEDDVVTNNTEEVINSTQLLIFIVGFGLLAVAVYVFIIFLNRVAMREKEQELRYRDQLFSVLAGNTDDVFILLSQELAVEYISPNVERLLGLTPKEVANDLHTIEITENDSKVDFRHLSEIEKGGSVTKHGSRIHKRTGERRWFDDIFYCSEVDDTVKYIGVLSDRTYERSSRMALQDALDLADAANHSKSAFLSNMSHDIRTPMNAVMGLTTLLKRDADDPERVREHTRKIEASGRHLLGIINDVLDMSKIESGKTTLNIEELNLADVVDEIVTIISPQAKAKMQEFVVNVENIHSERLMGDRLRINQVLINILSNSVKYTPAGGRIEFTVKQYPKDNSSFTRLKFTIKDNGMGMSKEFMATIFQPFTREQKTERTEMQGTGLGMAITKNLVDLMGGTIDVESEPDKGSVFTVNLELRVAGEDNSREYWSSAGIGSILVLDPDPDTYAGIIAAMTGTGVASRRATDAEYALIAADEEGFDLVLVGVNDPVSVKKLRAALPNSVLIAMISPTDPENTERDMREAGADGAIPKPFFISSLKAAVDGIRGGKNSAADDGANVMKGRHFLAAEDNEINSDILTELLDMVGATCETAANGKLAADLFESSQPGHFDAVLMDVQMPIMNGYEATKAIRASSHPEAKTIPIIAMTANAFADDVKNALDSGMNAHVAKPIDLSNLEAALRGLLPEKEAEKQE